MKCWLILLWLESHNLSEVLIEYFFVLDVLEYFQPLLRNRSYVAQCRMHPDNLSLKTKQP